MKRITSEIAVNSDVVRYDADHIIFVEGEENSLDKVVMEKLIPSCQIVPLGSSRAVRRYAEIVCNRWPKHYFLIDRDHHGGVMIERQRDSFMDINKPNLLIWNFREIENYFLNPDLLEKSEYLDDKFKEKLKERIISVINDNLLLDVANHAVGSVLGIASINFSEFKIQDRSLRTFDEIKRYLEEKSSIKSYISRIHNNVTVANIVGKITELKETLEREIKDSGHFSPLVMKYLQGKAALTEIINPKVGPSMFAVRDMNGKPIQGKERINRIIFRLLDQPENVHEDFLTVKRIIHEKIENWNMINPTQ